jgi:predicted MFS family arabinose efflux permease
VILAGIERLVHTLRAASHNTRRFLFGTFLMGIGHGAVWVHLNLYFRTLGLGEAAIGQIISASSLGVVIVSLPAAVWVDRFRAESIFVFAAAGFGATLLSILFFPHQWILLSASFLSGVFYTIHLVAAAPFYMRNAVEEHRTELFGISSALETFATVLSAFSVGVLARIFSRAFESELLGLRGALVPAAIVSLTAIIPFAKIRSRPFGKRRQWREYVYSRDMGLIMRLSLPAFLVGCGAGLTIPFLNLYFRDKFQQDPAQIGLYFSVAQVITMTGFIAGPILARRFTHVRAIVATEVLSIPFFLLLAIASNLWVAVIAFWMRGALMNMNQPVSNAFSLEIVHEDQQTVTNSVRTFSWNFAWMITTSLGGWLIERHGYAINMYLTMGLYLAAASLFWTFFRGRVVVRQIVVPVVASGEEHD